MTGFVRPCWNGHRLTLDVGFGRSGAVVFEVIQDGRVPGETQQHLGTHKHIYLDQLETGVTEIGFILQFTDAQLLWYCDCIQWRPWLIHFFFYFPDPVMTLSCSSSSWARILLCSPPGATIQDVLKQTVTEPWEASCFTKWLYKWELFPSQSHFCAFLRTDFISYRPLQMNYIGWKTNLLGQKWDRQSFVQDYKWISVCVDTAFCMTFKCTRFISL